jgi:hypothetical protein
MLKTVHLHQLKEGTDPEEAWRYWSEIHAPNAATRPDILSYRITRINKQIMKVGDEEKGRWWGIAEFWWDYDSADSMVAATDAFLTKPGNQEEATYFWSMFDWISGYIVEEKVIVDRIQP